MISLSRCILTKYACYVLQRRTYHRKRARKPRAFVSEKYGLRPQADTPCGEPFCMGTAKPLHLRMAPLVRKVGLEKLIRQFDVQHTSFTRYRCLVLHRRGQNWARILTYLFRR